MAVVSLLALCAMVGVAADLGLSFDDRRKAQTAADAAALAGAQEIRRGTSGGVVAAGNDSATANGFTNGVNGATVTINNPPTSGYYAANPAFVEAVVTHSRPSVFMGILGIPTAGVTARAVAGTQEVHNCIYALSRTGVGLDLNGSSTGLSAGCGVVVDSSSSPAVSVGSGSLYADSVAVTGTITGSCSTPNGATCQSGIPPAPDPLATRAGPTFSGCDYGQPKAVKITGGTVSLSPGVYCDGINISGGATVTFQPGTYILNGGGLSVSGSSTIQGTGVTFYNTGNKQHTYGAISISAGTLGFLYAPTSGSMQGMLFFQDRNATIKSGAMTNTVSGSSNLILEGIYYFPTTDLVFSGGGNIAIDYTIIVANTIKLSGNTTISANFSKLEDGNPIRTASLGE